MDNDSIERGFNRLVESAFEWIPPLLGAIVLIVLGLLIAGAVKKGVKRLLRSVDLDGHMRSATGGNFISRIVSSPTKLLSTTAYWIVLLGFISLGAAVLGIPVLTDLIYAIYGFIPDLVAALLIFLAASAIAAGAVAVINNVMGDTPTGKVLESIAPAIIMGIGIFMILDQLGIAETIVTITYAMLLGSVALASALAFGLGGRDVAARMLENGYTKAQESKGQVRHDVAVGKQRAKDRRR